MVVAPEFQKKITLGGVIRLEGCGEGCGLGRGFV